MDSINRWFDEVTSTPAGSILLFLLVFVARVSIDQYTQRRAARKKRPPRKATNG